MSDVFERIDASWHTLQASVQGVPDAALQQPNALGEWSIKDVLGHVGFWKSSIAQRAAWVADGRPALAADTPDEHWQIINEREAARRAGWSLEQVLVELQTEHERAVAALRRVPAEDLDDAMGDFIEHSDEHAAEIHAWRTAGGH